jgi:hypothetical protein
MRTDTRGGCVPQGSVLGPLLFTIYVNELPLVIKDSRCQAFLYADDTTLCATGDSLEEATKLLESELVNVASWLRYNSLKLN